MLDYMNQEQENLKNHCTISAIISYICRMKDLGTMMHGKYVTISWEEECKKYIVKLTHTDFINYYNPLGVVIESNQNAKRNQRFEILSWRNSYFIEHNLGKKTILEIAGEKKTDAEVLQEKVASSLLLSGIEKAINSTYATIIKVIADIQNNQENNIKLDTSVTTGTLDERHKDTNISGYLSYSTDGKLMYTPLTYSGDKAYIESVDGFMEFGRTQILDFSDKLSTPSFADEDSQKLLEELLKGENE